MMCVNLLTLLVLMAPAVSGQTGKCDQTPPEAKVLTPSETISPFRLRIQTKGTDGKYLNDQTYVLILETLDLSRPFREFMITAEDPNVDGSIHNFEHRAVDVGNLKTLVEDTKSRHSARCYNSVENTDSSDKYTTEIHWVSPKERDKNDAQEIRFRAMVAENKEVWYIGEDLTLVLRKDNAPPSDSSPKDAMLTCNLCSEARYEVIFKGIWSRGTHPRHYPSKPDDNGYSHMIGASHDYHFILWKQGTKASDELKKLAEFSDSTDMERLIINKMNTEGGTRTLIRGKHRRHPHMSEPSFSLFRVDRIHHLFSIVVAMRPSPDWFLGTSRFELCTEDGWLPYYNLSLYPWDAGSRDGISYDSAGPVTQPEDNVERVAVGSFKKESPFFQMSLIDLKAFATLEVRRLDVYPLLGADCSEESQDSTGDASDGEQTSNDGESQDEPSVAESRQGTRCFSAWSDWDPCVPDNGVCGSGVQRRRRFEVDVHTNYGSYHDPNDLQVKPLAKCEDQDALLQETRICLLHC